MGYWSPSVVRELSTLALAAEGVRGWAFEPVLGLTAMTLGWGLVALLLLSVGGLIWLVMRIDRRNRQLEAEHRRLSLVADHAVSAVLFADPEWRVRWVNAEFGRTMDVDPAAVVGRRVPESVPGLGEETAVWRGLRHAGAARLTYRSEFRFARDGREIIMELKGFPLRDATGRGWEFVVTMQDVTEQRMAEEELRRTTLMQEAILNGTPHMIIATRPDGLIIAFNRGAENMLGYRAEEVIGRLSPAALHVPEEIVARAQALTEELRRPVQPGMDVFAAKADLGLSVEEEYTMVRKDGSHFPVMVLVTAMRDREGDIIGYMGVARDVSDLKKAQSELARRESELRFLLNQLPIGVHWTYFVDGREVSFDNDGTSRITGLAHDQLRLPGAFQRITHPDDWAVQEKMTARLMAGEIDHYTLEKRYLRPDGTTVWVRMTRQLFRGPDGRRVQEIASVVDITEQRRRADELRAAKEAAEQMARDLRSAQHEARHAAIVLQHTAAGVVIADAQWNIQWVNDGFTRQLGYTLEDVQGLRAGICLVGPETDPATLAAMETADRERRAFKGELINYTKDGRKIWVSIETRPLYDQAGNFTGFMALQTDITQKREAEEELRAAKDAAERANLAKSQFLAMMSHEIRTPMNGVVGMTILRLDTTLDREQREFAETIRASSDALLTIINDILDFSKIESGHLDLERAEFSLRDCVEGALDVLAPRAAEKGLDLLYEIAEGTPGCLRGDQARLRQVLVNLLGNAVKFTERGEVVLSVHAGPPPAQPGAPVELCFAVRDTGIGIPADAKDRLFQSFMQVDASTTRKYGGTGLGLAISKRLVEMMDGRIWVESEPGRGSVFQFTICLVPCAPQPRAAPERVSLAGHTLLLVDDNATNLRILSQLARGWGLVPHIVEDPRAALDLIRRGERFDLAILDMQMPGLDGQMLAAEIRRLVPAGTMPLVLLSSIGQRCDSADFAAQLAKPVKPVQLYATLGEVLAVTRPPAAPEKPLPPKTAETRPDRLLVAEDNLVNRKVAQHLLQRLGYQPEIVEDGSHVLTALERSEFDVILLDVQMPQMDGFETARRVVALRPDPVTRPWIIALTANAMQGDREQCLAAGMDDYLSKPIKAAELSAALDRAREQRARRRTTPARR